MTRFVAGIWTGGFVAGAQNVWKMRLERARKWRATNPCSTMMVDDDALFQLFHHFNLFLNEVFGKLIITSTLCYRW